MKKILAVIVCAAALLALIGAAFYMSRNEETIAGAGSSRNAPGRTVTYQGVKYPLKRHVQTILLIGTDSTEEYVELPENERDYLSYHQADFLMLLVLDRETHTTQMIQINRDTMMDVPWLDVFGQNGGTEYKQICLAFNYGDGGAASCKNTAHAVSSLLFEVPIDAYIQIPMVAIPQLNDLVGGVSVTIEEDMTAVDPSFVQGHTVKLTGAQAERFVRARKAMADNTNIARMRRQREYIGNFIDTARKAIQSDADFSIKAVETLGSTLQTSMSTAQLSGLMTDLETTTLSPVRYAEGELKLGTRYYEFYVNEASLWDIVHDACCA